MLDETLKISEPAHMTQLIGCYVEGVELAGASLIMRFNHITWSAPKEVEISPWAVAGFFPTPNREGYFPLAVRPRLGCDLVKPK